jgi:hypothetical protein
MTWILCNFQFHSHVVNCFILLIINIWSWPTSILFFNSFTFSPFKCSSAYKDTFTLTPREIDKTRRQRELLPCYHVCRYMWIFVYLVNLSILVLSIFLFDRRIVLHTYRYGNNINSGRLNKQSREDVKPIASGRMLCMDICCK